jgi:hypothetical protein
MDGGLMDGRARSLPTPFNDRCVSGGFHVYHADSKGNGIIAELCNSPVGVLA